MYNPFTMGDYENSLSSILVKSNVNWNALVIYYTMTQVLLFFCSRSATPTPANYTTNQATAGYTVQHSAQPYAAAAAPAQRSSQSTYENYQQPTHTTTNYPYASRQQVRYPS